MFSKVLVATTLASVIASGSVSADRVDCDVAVIGGGAAGANAAVFLKDKGYSVCLFERRARLGGHCHSQVIPANEIPAGQTVNWYDNGVMIWQNTTWLKSKGIGNFNLSSDQHILRFINRADIINADFSGQGAEPSVNYNVDLTNQLGPLPSAQPTFADYIAFQTAFGTLVGKVMQYPWLEDAGNFPDAIPSELLQPFSSFIATYNLQALIIPFFLPQIVNGGLGSLEKMTTLYAMLNLRRGILALVEPEKGGIQLKGGCSKLYEKIGQYLSSTEQVYYNSQILEVNRPAAASNNGVIQIKALINGEQARFKTNKIIVAIPQTLSNLAFLDLDQTEKTAFGGVKTRVYSTSVVKVEGALKDLTTGWGITNLDVTQPTKIALTPAVMSFARKNGYGPASAYLVADSPMNSTAILSTMQAQLDRLPASLVTSVTVQRVMPHDFQPHFSPEDLAQSPSPYTKINSIQGRRNTYHIGSLYSFAESIKNWEFAYNLVQNNF